MQPVEIWAATLTPFDERGGMALDLVAAQAEHLQASGVDGAFVAGTTGEFPSMTVDEREALLIEWATRRPDGLRLAVHVGHLDLRQAQRLAAHAEKQGVEMIAAVAPFYGDNRLDHVVHWMAEVAAAAPRTPFCYYHIPSMTGSRLRPSEVVRRAAHAIPTLGQVKFTDADLLEFEATRAAAPDVRVYFGKDELLPAALAFGADGVIGSLYNGLAPVARAVAAAYDEGRAGRALELHEPFREIARAADLHGGVAFIKELMGRVGPDAGTCRAPWGPLSADDRTAATALVPRVRDAVAAAERVVGGVR